MNESHPTSSNMRMEKNTLNHAFEAHWLQKLANPKHDLRKLEPPVNTNVE